MGKVTGTKEITFNDSRFIEGGKLIHAFISKLRGRPFMPITDSLALNSYREWNSLMSIVDKIEALNYDVNILGGCWVVIKDSDPDRDEGQEIIDESQSTKRLTVYVAVVEFIKWYNRHNSNG